MMRRLRMIYSYFRRVLRGQPPELSLVLQRDVAELHNRYHSLVARQNAMQTYYEQRVDLIYRQVTKVLKQVLEDQHIVAETADAIEERYRRIFSSGFDKAVDLDRIRVGDLISGEMKRGVVSSPLTLQGFRVAPQLAREEGDAIRILGDSEGVAVDGPYLRLSPGAYRLSVEVATDGPVAGAGTIGLDVFAPATERVVAHVEAHADAQLAGLSLDFSWGAAEAADVVVFRIHQGSQTQLRVRSITLA